MSIIKRIESRVKETSITSPAAQAFVDFGEQMALSNAHELKDQSKIVEKGIAEQRVVERMTSVEGYQAEYLKTSKEFWELRDAYLLAKQSYKESQNHATDDFRAIRNWLLYSNPFKK